MKKIYVVMCYEEWERDWIVDMFSTKEKAEKFISENQVLPFNENPLFADCETFISCETCTVKEECDAFDEAGVTGYYIDEHELK